jgi:two-component system NtrC family sensor kinase
MKQPPLDLFQPEPIPAADDFLSRPAVDTQAIRQLASRTSGDLPWPDAPNRRILVVDDNPAIHSDFAKVLNPAKDDPRNLALTEAMLFGDEQPRPAPARFWLDSAHQGQEALEKVERALHQGKPYALAFMDVRMPPGWDGVETITRIWQIYPDLQVVLCTAYSDYTWEEMIAKLGSPDNLVILKKPFDRVEVLQLAHALTRKWDLNRKAQLKLDELAAMVEERTRELAKTNQELRREIQERIQAEEERVKLERQFRQAQKMEAIGQLAAGVAHDFNNILTVIQGYARMLELQIEEGGLNAKAVGAIISSSERAANLVRQLLLFSRKGAMQFRNVDLRETMQNLSNMLRELVGEHISIRTTCAPELAPIYADQGMIEQVIVNLVVNARDAISREGRIEMQASTVEITPSVAKANPDRRAGCFACLAISDTGSGIAPELFAHLFEPFFTTKEVGKGTGLGLATVYGIVRQHQGWIEVDSELGVGTTFRILFPFSNEEAAAPAEPRLIAQPISGSETILVAEDEPALAQMVADTLVLCGYRVLVADSGPAALQIWEREQGKIDLVLSDIVMPGGMMGTDLAAELRRQNPAVKVILTTGYSPGVTGVPDLLSEVTDFLAKPYSPRTLVELVRQCLDE